MRRTNALRAVLDYLWRHEPTHGYAIMMGTGLPSGTVYPILARLTEHGYLVSQDEPITIAHTEGRPPRRYVVLTEEGRSYARTIDTGTPTGCYDGCCR